MRPSFRVLSPGHVPPEVDAPQVDEKGENDEGGYDARRKEGRAETLTILSPKNRLSPPIDALVDQHA